MHIISEPVRRLHKQPFKIFGLKTKDLTEFTTTKKQFMEYSRMPNDDYLISAELGNPDQVYHLRNVYGVLGSSSLEFFNVHYPQAS